jgi:eukaryotic-like serine/threonine-protein kinase
VVRRGDGEGKRACDPVQTSPSDAVTHKASHTPEVSAQTPAPGEERTERPTGREIGRYLLLERVGEGGMGLVFAAFDPDLDRKVALKVLRGSGRSTESRTRLQREAQALARLDHPNVVHVFDVGTARGRVYIAMELIDGPTLKRWLVEKKRPWTEIMKALLEAGRGLEAAHTMGVVHRDFKPENVLVGTDGRTRVTDFGLARGMPDGQPQSSWSPALSLDPPDPRLADRHVEGELESSALTQAGTVVGTPAYMAPEQHRGQRATARSDQYSFCLSCFEALFGQRPFKARAHRELARLKAAGKLPAVEASDVPQAVRRVIERGLLADPARRWPSMTVLLSQLERATSPRSRRWRIPVVACCVGGFATAWALWPQPRQACSGASQRVATAWSDVRRAEAQAAFERSGVGYAEDAWPRAARLVDAYADEWTEHYVITCESGRRDDGSADLLDRRMACLGDRLAELEGLGSLLVDADAGVVENAIEAAMRLTPVRVCNDPPRMGDEGVGGTDPATVRSIEDLRRKSARVEVLLDAGKHEWAIDEARAALEAATRLGIAPTTAAARRTLGSAYERSGRYDEATTHLEEAFWEAESSSATLVAAHAAIDLVWIRGSRAVELDRALEWARHAQAALDRMDDSEYDEGRLALAVASSLTAASEAARAREEFGRALALFESSVGSEHPEIATTLNNLASSLLIEGRYDEARSNIERALELYMRSHGPEHPRVANAMINLAGVEQRTGNLERAVELGRRALKIRSAMLGPDHPDTATARNNLGATYAALEDHDNAERQYRAAAEALERVYGDDHPNTAAARINLGLVVDRQGRHKEALDILQPAFETLIAALPAGHMYVVFAQLGLGRAELGLLQHERAGQWLEPAFERCHAGAAIDPFLCALVSFERAVVRWHFPRTREAALLEAQQAVEVLRSSGMADEIARAEAWLGEHVLD